MKKVNESGRSMVEMLGVLAIIGVLSIGGIAGYTMAMNRYRANEGLAAANLAIVEAMARGEDKGYDELFGALPTGITSVEAKADGSATITYEDADVAQIARDLNKNDKIAIEPAAE